MVVAGCGVPVAKHGNRALSSKSGAADALSALGIPVMDTPLDRLPAILAEAGMCFLMAPRHHAALRHAAGPRMELGTRTIFNLLGPLANPGRVTRQVVGVFAAHWVRPLAETLGRLGATHAWVVHGTDGLDELSTTGETLVAEWHQGRVREFRVVPEDAGLPRANPVLLKGGDATENAEALTALLEGDAGAYRDIVVLNAAAAFVVAGRVPDLRAGAALAAQAIDSGAARQKLAQLVAITTGAA
jgi:anthranilate phosphoribosyltransferase